MRKMPASLRSTASGHSGKVFPLPDLKNAQEEPFSLVLEDSTGVIPYACTHTRKIKWLVNLLSNRRNQCFIRRSPAKIPKLRNYFRPYLPKKEPTVSSNPMPWFSHQFTNSFFLAAISSIVRFFSMTIGPFPSEASTHVPYRSTRIFIR